jgi:hypothetical protein
MYSERLAKYRELEKARGSRLIVYVTGDRRGLETQVHPEVLDYFVDHLDALSSGEKVPKISLLLYTRGGQTMAAWSIIHLLRQFCHELEVVVPAKAHSAGTLICLGSNKIVMTKQATLGPIDPSVNTPLNPPIPGAAADARYPVSVEAINGFLELAKEMGINDGHDRVTVLQTLAQHVHPLVLGQVYRSRSQIRRLGERLLDVHMQGEDASEKKRAILEFLCSESGSHDYTIYRREARDHLGLAVETPSEELYKLIWSIYRDIADELELTRALDPMVYLAGAEGGVAHYKFVRGLLESVRGGSDQYITEGTFSRVQLNVPIGQHPFLVQGAAQEAVQDQRSFDGWRHAS